jgi:predicted ATPase
MSHYISLLARAHAMARRVERALPLLDDALRIVETTGEGRFLAELHRHKGEFLREAGDAASAEGLFRRALGIAREQQAKTWELRAAMSLARLWRDQGRQGAARQLLAPVYGWFTEGFGTADLKKAKALLQEIG